MKLDLKVGDYVRTKYGISQYKYYDTSRGRLLCIPVKDDSQGIFANIEDIIKASDKLINLIEVGDYVNGKKVIDKWEEPFGEFVGQIFIKLEGEETIPTLRKIETIVTKEQFEQTAYKLD